MTASTLFDSQPGWADLSPCGTYRYLLGRRIGGGDRVGLWVMLNPSTADANEDDATIRRCIGFARREGCGLLEVVNLFAYRATDPAALRLADDPVGPANDHFISKAVERAALVVVAWGALRRPLARRLGGRRGDPRQLACPRPAGAVLPWHDGQRGAAPSAVRPG
jgi:hypothetical protein